MENNPDLQERIRELEGALQKAGLEAQKYESQQRELEQIREKYANDLYQERQQVQQWRTEARQWLHSYEQLRLQKGGFGFHSLGAAMTASGLLGAILCFGLMVLLNRRNDQIDAFRRDHLFQIEYALSQGNFQDARRILETGKHNKEYQKAQTPILMLEQTVIAAEKGCKR